MSIKKLSAVLVAVGVSAGVWPRGTTQESPEILVYKSASCECCAKWVERLRLAGLQVAARDVADMREVKRREGVPPDLASCHTALVEGYVVEGHVPARIVRRFLESGSTAKGIAVPGMPVGSPGMEGPNPKPYDVVAFDEAGNRTVFERVEPGRQGEAAGNAGDGPRGGDGRR